MILEEKYKEFFSWLFEKESELSYEIDIATEERVYYSKEIKKIIDNEYMQRLKKIMQLSTVIIDNENVFHTRYDHCLGTYHNGIKIYLNQFEKEEWRKKHESENKKLDIIASLIELLTHDIGHLTFSHTLESLIGQHGTHEILTDRIIEEKLDIELSAINKKLPDIMKQRRKNITVGTLKEGNIDLDRMDYLVHDVIYIDDNSSEIEKITQSIINTTTMENIGNIDIPVFENDGIEDIQKFLEFRANQYKKYYYSNTRNVLDNLCYCFCKIILNNTEEIALPFKEYLKHCVENKTELELEKHLNWNDVKTLNAFIEIAEKSENQDLVETAIACMPSLNGMINLVYKMTEFPEEVDQKNSNLALLIPDEDECKFYKTIKKYVKGKNLTQREQFIRNKLLLDNKLKKDINMYEFSNKEELNQIQSKIREIGVAEEIISQITWESKIKVYSSKFPNFTKTENGEIVEILNHPDFNLDTTNQYIRGAFINEPLLKSFNLSVKQIEQLKQIFENYEKHKINISRNRRVPTIFDKEDYILGDR